MLIICQCLEHHATYSIFKCPDYDYTGGDGVVHPDLPEKYNKLQAENEEQKRKLRFYYNIFGGRRESQQVVDLQIKIERLEGALQAWIDANEGAPNKYEWAKQALAG